MSELVKYRNLIRELVSRDIKKKYRRSVLGILWSLLNPLFMMLITAAVFSNLFRFDIKNFALYLLSGQIIFTFYAEATNFAMGSILENGSLIKKIYVPKYLFPISRVLSSGVNLMLTIPAMLVIMYVTNEPIGFYLFYALIPMMLLLCFCIGMGLLLSSLAVYFRDLFHLYSVILTALNYATPIFYPINIIPDEYKFIIWVNPLTYYLTAFRQVVYDHIFPDINILLTCIGLSIIVMFIGIFVFKKQENKFVLYI